MHVLTVARDPRGVIWVGTYGHGIYRLPVGATAWESIRHDTTGDARSPGISCRRSAFGARGQIWYGTIGNGWGLSTDGGATWKNWAYKQLGPEWQYVAPSGIVVRGDTTLIGTADGIQLTTNDGATWTALGDAVGPRAKGPADTVFPVSEERICPARGPRPAGAGTSLPSEGASGFGAVPPAGWPSRSPPRHILRQNALLIGNKLIRGTQCGLKPNADTLPCLRQTGTPAEAPRDPLTTWFRRPIALTDNSFIDQTYRYGSTMGGNFQQHQGVEFNNPDGTPVLAIGAGTVVYAGPAEAGALTVTHPPRHAGQRATASATASSRPTTTTRP